MKRARLVPARMCPRRRLTRRAGAPGQAWKPVALGWRKAARALSPLAGRPAGWAVRQSWSPRFHFHFAIRSGVHHARPGKAAPGTPATTILWRRIDARLSRLLPVVRTTSTHGWRTIAHRVEHALLTRWRGRREASWSEIVRMFRTTVSAPVQPGARAATSTTATIFRRLPVAEAASPPSRPPLRLEPRLLRPHQRGAAPVPAGQEGRVVTTPRAPVRPAELVWRTQVEERSAQAAERMVRAAAASVSPLPAAAAAPPSWPPAQAVEALRPRLLDGALIDRLAEDVIGRVEKKIRIERERRGV